MAHYWTPPTEWTVQEANRRATEVFSDPFLSKDTLPPEASLLFPIKPPEYPLLINPKPHKRRQAKRNERMFEVRDIPWLPEPFDMNTPAWKLNLYQIFGATCRDMVDRVDPRYDPGSDRQLLSNRLVKRCGDYRTLHGGFCKDYKAFKNGQPTSITTGIIKGAYGKRNAMTREQMFFVGTT
jgi:hypothetical protein